MVLDGTWKSTDTWGGFAAGMLVDPDHSTSHVPQDIAAEGYKVQEAIITARVIRSTVRSRTKPARVKVAAGGNMPDGEIAGLNWYVQGVEGDLRIIGVSSADDANALFEEGVCL